MNGKRQNDWKTSAATSETSDERQMRDGWRRDSRSFFSLRRFSFVIFFFLFSFLFLCETFFSLPRVVVVGGVARNINSLHTIPSYSALNRKDQRKKIIFRPDASDFTPAMSRIRCHWQALCAPYSRHLFSLRFSNRLGCSTSTMMFLGSLHQPITQPKYSIRRRREMNNE